MDSFWILSSQGETNKKARVSECVCFCACVCTCVYACASVCVHTYVCECLCLCVYVYVSACVSVYACVCKCVCTCVMTRDDAMPNCCDEERWAMLGHYAKIPLPRILTEPVNPLITNIVLSG